MISASAFIAIAYSALLFAIEFFLIFLIQVFVNQAVNDSKRVYLLIAIFSLAAGFVQHLFARLTHNHFAAYNAILLLFSLLFAATRQGDLLFRVTWGILSVTLHFMSLHIATVCMLTVRSSLYVSIVLSRGLLCIITLLIRRISKKIDYDLPPLFRISFLVMALILYALQNVMILSSIYEAEMVFSPIQMLYHFGLTLSYIAICLIVYMLYISYAREYNRNLKESLISQQLAYLSDHYDDISTMYDAMRKLRHDLVNHISCIDGLLKKNELIQLQAYVKALGADAALSEDWIESGHPVMNAVINKKYAEAREKHITVDTDVLVPPDIQVPDTELCALFANLLDNAIEACQHTATPYVAIQVEPVKGVLSILVKNSADIESLKRNPNLKSTKKDMNSHGLGRKIVTTIIEKYDGDEEITLDSGFFTYSATLPINTDSVPL